MKTDLFHLEILPIDRIVEHEVFDARRMEPILARLQEEKRLVNPILVAPMDDGRYLQLDGMNRLSAFRKLNIPTIAAQIVDYTDDVQVKLLSWMHLYRVPNSVVTQLAEQAGPLQALNDSSLVPIYAVGGVATIISKEKKMYQVTCSGSDREKAKTILTVVHAYESAGIIRESVPDTFSEHTIASLYSSHPDAHGMVLFPTFTKEQIMSLVKDGGLLPAGITRHVVKNRCLNVTTPLDLMMSTVSLKEKNDRLDVLLSSRSFRRYEEPVVYIE